MTKESEVSMQELSDACEKTLREKGYDRRKEASTDYQGIERRKEEFDRRKNAPTEYEGLDRRVGSTKESGLSMQELSDACEKTLQEKGYDRRKEGYDRRQEGADRREEGFDRREEGSDRRKEALTDYQGVERRKAGYDRRQEGADRRLAGFDRREEGFDRRETLAETSKIRGLLESRTFKIKAGLALLLIAVAFFFAVPIPGLGIINDNEYVVTKVEGRAYMKYQTEYTGDQAKGKGLTFQVDGEWTPLKEGTVIAAGSRIIIETGSDSTVDLLTDEGMIVRIAKNSTVRLEEKPKKTSRIQGFVAKGKIFVNIVSAKLKRFKDKTIFKIEVSTPNATCGVRGTIFSVDHQPDAVITDVSVLTGVLNVTDPETAQAQTSAEWHEVKQGQAIQLLRNEKAVEIRELSAAEMKMLSESAPSLDANHTLFERFERTWRELRWWLSLVEYSQKTRAENEMGSIIMSLYQKGIVASATFPDPLPDKKIPGGDVKDPWGHSYLYIRYRPDVALVISAGPDGIYNTPDDLYRFLSI
ncbi:MAG: hypothetical protein HPY65_12445 [Syntrophaceae bacterium]|nr:hypothetical protein [Syntrophaceae bacterium]